MKSKYGKALNSANILLKNVSSRKRFVSTAYPSLLAKKALTSKLNKTAAKLIVSTSKL